MKDDVTIWVFCGLEGQFPSGVFSSKKNAENWILTNKLEGVLTKYPVDISVYDWTIKNKVFSPKKDHEKKAQFIQTFSSASQEHYHFEIEDGEYI